MEQFQYSSEEEINFFKRTEKELRKRLKIGDSAYIIHPSNVTVDNTPNGMEVYEYEGVYYRCVVGEDSYGNLVATNCEYLKGEEMKLEEGELLRHLVGAEFLINKVEHKLI